MVSKRAVVAASVMLSASVLAWAFWFTWSKDESPLSRSPASLGDEHLSERGKSLDLNDPSGLTPAIHRKSAPPPARGGVNSADEAVLRVHQEFLSGGSPQACSRAKDDLVRLVSDLPENSELWNWAMTKVEDCFLLIPGAERKSFLERLLAGKPDNPRILMALARTEFGQARTSEAIQYLEQALRIQESADAWGLLALAKSTRAEELRLTGGDDKARLTLLSEVESALTREIELAGARTDAWTFNMMAQAKLGLGKNAEAIEWAEKTLHAIKVGQSSDPGSYEATNLYFSVGSIYYKTGQRDTGIAYMDYAISLAAPAQYQAQLSQMKRNVLEGKS